eukprot:2718143-Pyramimonas_sp.AAC.1
MKTGPSSLTQRIRAGRALLHRAGRESLVQRVLRKQWEWAKDISVSLCHHAGGDGGGGPNAR